MPKRTRSSSYDPKSKTNTTTERYTRNDGSGYVKREHFKMTGGGLFKQTVGRSRTDFSSSKKK